MGEEQCSVAPFDARPTYKLRFPSTGPGLSKYLMFTEDGSLLIETEDYKRHYDERFTWLEPEDTIKFLDAIGEEERRPEFDGGEPTHQTKAMLRRIIKQFSSTDDLSRCWKHIGARGKSFRRRDSE
jgi:hypothetical protein